VEEEGGAVREGRRGAIWGERRRTACIIFELPKDIVSKPPSVRKLLVTKY